MYDLLCNCIINNLNFYLKVKNGTSKRYWCVLLSRHFLYYKTPTDKVSCVDKEFCLFVKWIY